MAAANAEKLARDLEILRGSVTGEHRDRVDAFCRMVRETGGISINMKPDKLLRFLGADRYLTVREIAAEFARGSGVTPEESLRLMQREYYERRVLFETSFEEGERFLYAALNIGGSAGISGFGVFCAFFDRNTIATLPAAYLPDDSLRRYVPNSDVLFVDHAGLNREVAPHTERHSLAAIKHCDNIALAKELDWPAALCGPACYVEVIFVGELRPAQMLELRVKRNELNRLYDMGFDEILGMLREEDGVELKRYNECMEQLERRGLAGRLREV